MRITFLNREPCKDRNLSMFFYFRKHRHAKSGTTSTLPSKYVYHANNALLKNMKSGSALEQRIGNVKIAQRYVATFFCQKLLITLHKLLLIVTYEENMVALMGHVKEGIHTLWNCVCHWVLQRDI